MKLEFFHPEEIEVICQEIDKEKRTSINIRIEKFRKRVNKVSEDYEEGKEMLIERIREWLYLKFVVIKKKGSGEEMLVKLFNHPHTHYQQFEGDSEDFIGAGKLFLGDIYWESKSFIEQIERDRPEKDADQILMKVREKIEQWIEDLVDKKLNISSLDKDLSDS